MHPSIGVSVEFAATEYDDNPDWMQRSMMPMSTTLSWHGVLLRLALTVVADMLIGYNRSEHGKAAGMRTMLLVCLAASVSMIQVNVLLAMAGRTPDSFVMNDLMRLPHGIFTGVGFIGGGAICVVAIWSLVSPQPKRSGLGPSLAFASAEVSSH